MADTRVVVHGALGRMGQTVLGALAAEPGMTPVGGADTAAKDAEISVPGSGPVPLSANLGSLLERTGADVVVDFTNAAGAISAIRTGTAAGVRVVSGSTGLSKSDLEEAARLADKAGVGVISASNFALGAVVLMHLARIAARFFEYADVIESHHEMKIDAPSGTALSIAQALAEGKGGGFTQNVTEKELLDGTRGGAFEGINVHSARMPGRVARHEVVLGAQGQTLTLLHDSVDRGSFMPGVMLAVHHVLTVDHLVVGLDTVLGLRD